MDNFNKTTAKVKRTKKCAKNATEGSSRAMNKRTSTGSAASTRVAANGSMGSASVWGMKKCLK